MKEAVRSFDPGKEYYTAEGCHILELANAPEDPDVSIARRSHRDLHCSLQSKLRAPALHRA